MLFLDYFKKLKAINVDWKEKEITPLLKNGEKILDFGCGDLLFARKLKKRNKSLKMTGVDVVNAHALKNISFVKYEGDKLPFENGTFDTVISVYVFHHCDDAELAFKECLRVAKKRVILIEAIARNRAEILPMKFMDWFFNVWKPEPIPLTFQFKTLNEWETIFKNLDLKIGTGKKIKNPISILPIGNAYLFEVSKRKRSKQDFKRVIQTRKKTKIYIGGTFDLLHHGHIELLKTAKKMADIVIVSLNTDEFNAQYKGKRPIMNLEERIAVVSACKYVDRVDVNDGGADSRPAILRNKPDFILHGDDWVGESFMKQLGIDEEFLKKNKIKLKYMPLVTGISSTELRKRTRSRNHQKGIQPVKTTKDLKYIRKILP